MKNEISAIILGAGASTRMNGPNKLLLPFNDSVVIKEVVYNLLGAGVAELIIVAGHDSKKIKNLFATDRVKVVVNNEHQKGMTSSIKCGLRACSTSTKGFLICLGDMPLLTPSDYLSIINAQLPYQKCIVKPFYEREGGNPILFSNHFRKEILAHTEPEGCRKIVVDNQDVVIKLDFEHNHVLKDIDTQEDYIKLRK